MPRTCYLCWTSLPLVTLFPPLFFVSLAKWSQVGWDFKRDQIYKRHNLQSRWTYFQVRTADGEDSGLKVHPTPRWEQEGVVPGRAKGGTAFGDIPFQICGPAIGHIPVRTQFVSQICRNKMWFKSWAFYQKTFFDVLSVMCLVNF